MKVLRHLSFLILLISISLIGLFGCGDGSSSDNNDVEQPTSYDDGKVEQTTLYNDYKTLSNFTKDVYTAKLKFMSVMSNGFESPYGEVDPEEGDIDEYLDIHTRVLESIDKVDVAVKRIVDAKKEPRVAPALSSQIMFSRVVTSAKSVFTAVDNTGGKTDDFFITKAWNFLVEGLGGSGKRSRERIINTLNKLSEEGKQEAYEYAKTARGIKNRNDVEDNADDFWKSVEEGKYDHQCAVLYNDLTSPSALIVDELEFADVAEKNSVSGNPTTDAVIEEGTKLIKSAKDFNPAIDGNVLGDEVAKIVEKQMLEEVKKFQKHTNDHYSGDNDKAVESFVDSVKNAADSADLDPNVVDNLSKATKKAVNAIAPAEDDATFPDGYGLLTVKNENGQPDGSPIVIVEGKDAEGNPSVYISDMRKIIVNTLKDTIEELTITLPVGTWDVIAADPNSVIDSISAKIDEGLTTIADMYPTPMMTVSANVLEEKPDSITYLVTASLTGISSPITVTLSLQNAITNDDVVKSLSADGTVGWSVTVLEDNGVVTVTRSDTNEGQSVTLKGITINYDGVYYGTAVTTYIGENCFCWDEVSFEVDVNGTVISGDATGTVTGNKINGYYIEYPELIFTGEIIGNGMTGRWYDSVDECCSGSFRMTKQ